jgi:signal transduction histidine kinase/CheY-like chemotaxis protein
VNPAVLIPICAAVFNFTSGIVLVAISRAPGWRMARASAAIALTAGLYCVTAIPYGFDGLDQATYLATARATYVVAVFHTVAWVVFAFGGREASRRALTRPIRWMVGGLLAVTGVFAATGAHLRHEVTTVDVAWAGVRYHYPVATLAGDIFGLAVPAVMGLVLWRLVSRVRAGERELRWHVAGFAVFLGCALDEVLVANRVIVFLSLADFGLIAIVLPLTITLVRRVIADARRLEELSGALENQVRERTEERDRAESALVESERLAALGRLAAGVGHEVNNPLTYLQLAIADIRRYTDEADVPPEVRGAVANAEDGSRRIQKVVEGLRSHSRRQDDMTPLDLREVSRAALKVAWPQLRHVANVETALDEVPLVLGDEPRLVQALTNLLTNAAQAMEGRRDGTITVRTAAGPGGVMLGVHDNGPGIPAELLARVSEPYFTTRARSGGLGLGLFVTRGIVDAHGGRLEFDSAPGTGTTAVIVLPPIKASPPAESPTSVRSVQPEAEPAFELAQSRGRILLVDDEPLVVGVLSVALGRTWDVTAASSARDALLRIAEQDFDAVVCDLMMPGMSGIELADTLAKSRPELRARMLFLTGGAVGPAAEEFLDRPDVRHLMKPVKLPELNGTLRAMLETAEFEPGN